MLDLIIKDANCVLTDPKDSGQLIEEQVDIGIKEGYIAEIGQIPDQKAAQVISFKNLTVLPGLIDSQVHFREPGLEYKEDIHHGTKSAIKGGITAVFEMPNTNPATMTKEALQDKINRAEKTGYCDFAFYLGSGKGNASQLNEIENMQGCPGVKVFMGTSTGNLAVDDEETLTTILKNRKRMTAIHSEDETRLQERKHLSQKPNATHHDHALWRDEESALISTKRVVRIARQFQTPIHILHISTKQELDFLKDHKDLVTLEATPQHLTLHAPECYDLYKAYAQMNPPIRDKSHQEALWKAIREGVIDIVGSDHAPHTKEEKEKPYPQSPSGIPGVQTMLPLMLNHMNNGKLDLKTLVRLLSLNVVKRFQIKDQGEIKVGHKAHFTVVDLKANRKIESKWLASKCGWSPFENFSVTGWPIATILYGKVAMRDDEVLASPSIGQKISFSDIS